MHKVASHTLGLIAGLLICSGVDGQSELISRVTQVDRIFADWDKPDSPGCAVGVIREGELIYARGFGMANLEHGVRITPQSAFYVASTSKQFTAMAVFLLAKEGKVSLDSDIREYVPELPVYERPVTIRHLMHHTSGIRDYLMLKQYAGICNSLNNEEKLALIARQKELNFTPGSRSAYSNSGYWLLSLIVERQSGMSLGAYAKKHIFEPLGMVHTRFQEDPDQVIQGRVQGYTQRDNGSFMIKDSSRPSVGPGGVVTTLEDLLLWDRNFYDPRVGGDEVLQQMLTPGRLTNDRSIREAAGLIVDRYKGQPIVEHSGRGRGFACQMLRFPEQHFSVIVLFNLHRAPADQRCFDIADIYLADVFPAATTKRLESTPTSDPSVVVAADKLKALTGLYVEGGDVLEIAFRDGALSATINGLTTRALTPLGGHRFRVEGRAWTLQFPLNTDAQPDSVALEIKSEPDPVTFRVPHTVSAEEAGEFLGQYRSEELDAVYHVLFEQGRLLIRFNDPSKREVFPDPLIRLNGDSFTDGSMTQIRFLRGRDEIVTGLRIDDPRVSNVRFAKLNLPGEGSKRHAPGSVPAATSERPAAESLASQQAAQVDDLFTDLDSPDSPGCAVAVIKQGEVIYERCFGMANLEYGIPFTSKTVTNLASASKQFTAVAVFMLAQDGKLFLDEDIRKHLPEMPEYEQSITVRQLIHHTSGIRDYVPLVQYAGTEIQHNYISNQRIFDLITRQRDLNFTPGTAHRYSNSGYFLLGLIVERVSGQPLAEFAKERIFQPLGMNSTRYLDSRGEIIPNRATGYAGTNGSFQRLLVGGHAFGAGGVFSSVEDLLLWDRNFYEPTVGDRALLRKMTTPLRFPNGEAGEYAGGLYVAAYKGLKVIEHSGGAAGYKAQLMRFPQQQFSIIVLANRTDFRMTDTCYRIADVYLQDYYRETNGVVAPHDQAESAASAVRDAMAPVMVDEAALRRLVGLYSNPSTSDVFRICLVDGKLVAAYLIYDKFELSPLSETRFLIVGTETQVIEFDRPDAGMPRSLTYRGAPDDEGLVCKRFLEATPETIEQMVGAYFSPELNAVYRFTMSEGILAVRSARQTLNASLAKPSPLEQLTSTSFTDGDSRIYRFSVSEDGTVATMSADFRAAKGLRFFRLGGYSGQVVLDADRPRHLRLAGDR
ncbi:MAG: serine hydrolase domain-containing protein [Phycisphaerales bacterium]